MGSLGIRNLKHHELHKYYTEYEWLKAIYPNFINRVVRYGEAKETAILKYGRIKCPNRLKSRVDDNGRVCTKCNKYKIWTEYSRSVTGCKGRTNDCKSCRNKHRQEYRKATNYKQDREYKKQKRTLELWSKIQLYRPTIIDWKPIRPIRTAIKYEFSKWYTLYNEQYDIYDLITLWDNHKTSQSCKRFIRL